MYESSTKETKWVCIQLACSQRPRELLRKPIIGIYKPSSIMKNSHQYIKVTTQETLYHEDHGAILKHKCGKRDSSIVPSLFFSHFSTFSLFLWPLFFIFFYFRPVSHPDLWGNHSLHHPFLTWDNALIMKIITLLWIYNSRITTQSQNKV